MKKKHIGYLLYFAGVCIAVFLFTGTISQDITVHSNEPGREPTFFEHLIKWALGVLALISMVFCFSFGSDLTKEE